MGNSLNNYRNFIDKTGVRVSIAVTFMSVLMLFIALLGIQYEADALESLCFFSLIIELIYGVIVSFNVLKKKKKYRHLVPFLFLNWFIGCFCTNVIINIFENLPVWVYLVTFLFCISNFYIYATLKNKKTVLFFYFVNGFSYLLIVYYAIYLIPFAPISTIGILALGLGFYGLVPMLVLISHAAMLVRLFPANKMNMVAFASGIGCVLIGLSIFVVMLNSESKKLGENTITKSFKSNDDLPSYITISQHLQPNFFNEILLKKGVVYVYTEDFFAFKNFDSFGGKQYNERRTHNPFVNIAYMFSEDLDLSADDRINILKSNFNKGLETEEQLWSGKDLITKNIKEDIKIFANERLAYTEITMDIACDKDTWGQKEAIYSFQLPEGAVASSLSLWVNGIERKGVLTTKEKAQKAYEHIVGVEARDPSLMQWREGNRVVVRVFPISYKLPRTFKCGFTTPLKVENNEMKYQSLNIKGPNISNAETLSRIQMVGNAKFEADKDFELKNGFYTNESTGLESWEVVMPLSEQVQLNSFVWKDKVYEIKAIEKQTIPFVASEVVIDLNSAWSVKEVEDVINQKGKNYFVFINNEKQAINEANYESVLSQFEDLHYSLLPFHKFLENSLVITKSGTVSANFEELASSRYLQKLKMKTKQKQIRVINISDEINPFWQTMKEQHYVDYYKTDLKNALKLLSQNQFVSLRTRENSVNIEPANISIQENLKADGTESNGSNHIYRMYAFGKVLEEQVKIEGDSLAENEYVALAKDANIVTPISSLIVLETDADYENNGIEKNVDTLGNASINNDGAVPEPHEWLLIIIGMSVLFFYYKKSKRQTA